MLMFDCVDNEVNQCIVYVTSSKVRITMGGLNLNAASLILDDTNVQSTSAKVEYKDHLGLKITFDPLMEGVVNGGCCRLIEDLLAVEACKLTCPHGSYPLRILEIGRDRDDAFPALVC